MSSSNIDYEYFILYFISILLVFISTTQFYGWFSLAKQNFMGGFH